MFKASEFYFQCDYCDRWYDNTCLRYDNSGYAACDSCYEMNQSDEEFNEEFDIEEDEEDEWYSNMFLYWLYCGIYYNVIKFVGS